MNASSTRRWLVAGILLWGLLLAFVFVAGKGHAMQMRPTPHHDCLCPDSIPVHGPRALESERP